MLPPSDLFVSFLFPQLPEETPWHVQLTQAISLEQGSNLRGSERLLRRA